MEKKADPIFIGVLVILFAALLSIAFILFVLSYSSNIVLYRLILNIILILTIVGSFYIIINTILFTRLLKGKKLSKRSKEMAGKALKLLYPQVLFLAQLLKFKKDRVRRVFSEINNKLILSYDIVVKPEEILLLLPHCLQNSNCVHKITNRIENCKKCGKCSIDSIIDIQREFNIKVHVATGGTLARKIVREVKPKLIIAVACERDLSSGILDIQNIPVMGVLLERPEGPCVNTRVDLSKVREAIKLFIKEDENLCSFIHPSTDSDRV